MIKKLIYKTIAVPALMVTELRNQIINQNNWTTIDYFHRHSWSKKNKYTSINGAHKHKIDLKKKIALPSGFMNHTHKLRF